MQDLGTLGGRDSTGIAINDAGQITGGADTADARRHVYIASATQPMQDLDTLGTQSSVGNEINNSGLVVGILDTTEGLVHVFIASAMHSMQDLGTLGGRNGYGVAINDAGQVTGGADTADGQMHAFIASATQPMMDLGTLGGEWAEPEDINDAGQITGTAENRDKQARAFIGTASPPLHDLGTLGGSSSRAYDVNNAGQVTGAATVASGAEHAFVASATQPMLDLGTLGGETSIGWAINDAGQVAGAAATADGYFHAFRATPISLLFTMLLEDVTGVGPGSILTDQVQRAFGYYRDDDGSNTCNTLTGFVALVNTQSGLEIPPAQAAKLAADAREIQSAVHCGVEQIVIDVKPHASGNGIALTSAKSGNVRVALLGSAAYDALQVDPESARFGPGEATARRSEIQDFNRDGFTDLGLLFRIRDLRLRCGDQQVTLTAETYAGTALVGTDLVHAWKCHK
jgi:probable HAF family extracellular repeat protein